MLPDTLECLALSNTMAVKAFVLSSCPVSGSCLTRKVWCGYDATIIWNTSGVAVWKRVTCISGFDAGAGSSKKPHSGAAVSSDGEASKTLLDWAVEVPLAHHAHVFPPLSCGTVLSVSAAKIANLIAAVLSLHMSVLEYPCMRSADTCRRDSCRRRDGVSRMSVGVSLCT